MLANATWCLIKVVWRETSLGVASVSVVSWRFASTCRHVLLSPLLFSASSSLDFKGSQQQPLPAFVTAKKLLIGLLKLGLSSWKCCDLFQPPALF